MKIHDDEKANGLLFEKFSHFYLVSQTIKLALKSLRGRWNFVFKAKGRKKRKEKVDHQVRWDPENLCHVK